MGRGGERCRVDRSWLLLPSSTALLAIHARSWVLGLVSVDPKLEVAVQAERPISASKSERWRAGYEIHEMKGVTM